MINVKASVWENVEGKLYQKGKGICTAYAPENTNGEIQYVSLNFGQYHIHLNKEDFTKLCQQFLKLSLYNNRKELK